MPTNYVPGEMARQYERLAASAQAEVNTEVDALFRKKTGIARKLNPRNPADQPLMQEWLRLRDQVMARAPGSHFCGGRPSPPRIQAKMPAVAEAMGDLKGKYLREFEQEAARYPALFQLAFDVLENGEISGGWDVSGSTCGSGGARLRPPPRIGGHPQGRVGGDGHRQEDGGGLLRTTGLLWPL